MYMYMHILSRGIFQDKGHHHEVEEEVQEEVHKDNHVVVTIEAEAEAEVQSVHREAFKIKFMLQTLSNYSIINFLFSKKSITKLYC